MLPLLLSPPAGRPARVLGAGAEVLPFLQALTRVGWPVTLHEPSGGGALKDFPGIQVTSATPLGPGLRQASLVLITSACPADWREAALKELEGAGVPLWDALDEKRCTLNFPLWFPGVPLSMAFWGSGKVAPWEAALAEDFFRETGGLFHAFVALAGELRGLVLQNATEEEFRRKVVSQLTRPEVLALLVRGDYQQAKTLALKIVGTTTRALD